MDVRLPPHYTPTDDELVAGRISLAAKALTELIRTASLAGLNTTVEVHQEPHHGIGDLTHLRAYPSIWISCYRRQDVNPVWYLDQRIAVEGLAQEEKQPVAQVDGAGA